MDIHPIIDGRLKSGTAQGQILFWDNTLKRWVFAETSELFWDDTNKVFGLLQDSNLVSWVRGYLSGTNAVDEAGSTVWAKAGDATNTDAGVLGPALTFDGTGDWFTDATPDSFPTGTSARTIYMRIRKNVTGDMVAFSYGGAANGASFSLQARSTGQFAVTVAGGNVFGTSTVLNDLKWHSIAVTFDPADAGFSGSGDIRNAKLYVDGVFTANTTSVEQIINTTNEDAFVGVFRSGLQVDLPFNGEIDELQIYSRVLTAAEILEVHQLGSLDAGTTFSAAYYEKYLASRSGYFSRLVALAGDIRVGRLEVTGALDIDINASDLIGTGDILPETDGGEDLGSAAKTFRSLYISDSIVLDDSAGIGVSGAMELTFDINNSFFEFIGGRVGIGTTSPNAPLEVKGALPGSVGGFPSGHFHVTGDGTAEFSNSVITGHSAYNTNTQLWYLGSTSSSNNDVAFINRQNAAMHFYTNNASKMIIDAAGNVGIGLTTVDANYRLIIRRAADINLGIGLQSSELAIAAFNDALSANIPMRFYASEFNLLNGSVGINTTTPNAKLQVVGDAHFGENITNFSEFESDGTLKFNGNATVFRDINIGAATLSGPPGLQPGIANFVDNLGADTGIATSGLAVGEGFSGELEMQHDYKEGSDITFHVHFEGIAAPTGTDKVQFQLTYTVGHIDTTLAPVTVIPVEIDFDTQYEFKLVSFAPISGTGIHIEDQFLFTFQRIAASADEYGGEALIATVGIHYEVDTVGSRQILVK